MLVMNRRFLQDRKRARNLFLLLFLFYFLNNNNIIKLGNIKMDGREKEKKRISKRMTKELNNLGTVLGCSCNF